MAQALAADFGFAVLDVVKRVDVEARQP